MGTPGGLIRRRLGALALLAATAAALVALPGCELKDTKSDLVAGKKAYVAKCGRCHVLARANSQGNIGPNLDESFQRALRDGFKRKSIRGIVQAQILYPARGSAMPAKLATGEEAEDIAAYVAYVSARGGKDTGALAAATGAAQKPLATAKNGTLTLPADPTGQLIFTFKNAEAPPGPLVINTPNASQVPHNIAIQGGPVGPVIQGGKISTVNFDAKPGKVEFLCTVQGHAQAGMKGILTVKP